MKRIGIITFQKCGNLGADLQAYALCAKLRSMGYDAENIDYLHCLHPRHIKSRDSRPVLPMSSINVLKARMFPFVRVIREWRGRKARKACFDKWAFAHIKTSKEYRDIKSLYSNPPQYDVYMTGGDQVWNPRLFSNIKPYFLDFAPEKAKCVSYASSFGVDMLSGIVFGKYKQWLKRFSYIGVREKSGADIINSMSLGVEVKHVVDPTLLLTADEWKHVAVCPSKVPDKPYLLLYDLLVSPEIRCFAKRWASDLGVEIVRIGDGVYGPGEFLWLCEHATAIVTNSFHGTVFSVINKKPFYSMIPNRAATGGRIQSFLNTIAATDRLVDAKGWKALSLTADVCYAEISERLRRIVSDSVNFLTREIESSANKKIPRLPLGCYAAWNKNNVERAQSTSGGIFRVLAEEIINSHGGCVFGAAFSPDFHSVKHIAADTLDALNQLMKSKYVWSDPTDAYKSAIMELKKGRHVLFAGTPCQIAAVKGLAKGYDGRLLTIDIVCHGTPRADMFASYIVELEKRFGSKCVSYDFRDKRKGWNFPCVNAEFAGGRRSNMILRNDPWYLGFGLNATLREGCFSCPYTTLERVADFTIADCWRIAASNPEWDDNKGTSLVLVNTEKAKPIWDRILASGHCGGGAYDLDLAQMRNMPLMQKPIKPACYDVVRRIFEKTKSFSAASTIFMSKNLVWGARLVYVIKKLGWFYFKHRQ